jgi:hypothetical protein
MFSSNTSSAEGGYQISRSLRFNSADSAYLNRTPASAGNRKTWTLSTWFKRSALPTSGYFSLFGADSGAGSSFYIAFDNSTQQFEMGQGATVNRKTTQVFRDPSAWYHLVVTMDTTQATASDRLKIYINGSQITAFATSNDPSLNSDFAVNNNVAQSIGADIPSSGARNYFNGYMTEVYLIDGQQLTPSSFGETNAQTGVWQPKAYSGSYGTNGFYLNFSDNSNTTAATLGKDYSGNGNNWTPNNFSVSAGAGNDSLVDTPTPYGVDTGAGGNVRGNYCTLNPLNTITANITLANGNLDYTQNTSGGLSIATFGISTGKWYWEHQLGATNYCVIGMYQSGSMTMNYLGLSGVSFAFTNGSSSVYSGISAPTGSISSFTSSDTIGFAYDADAGTLTVYRNNVSSLVYSGLTGTWFPAQGANGAASGIFNFGQRPFAYTAPSGFRALCTQNLPTPTIGATSTTQAGKYFNPVLYTGNSSSRTITGVGFQPDFTWIKIRDAIDSHYLFDAVRGKGTTYMKTLYSNATNAESPGNSTSLDVGVTDFASDGFTFGSGTLNGNQSPYTFVAWNWKANGAGSTNTAGSITSTVSANTTSGFSIVTWTGNSANATIGHGLGVAPSMVIIKYRGTTDNWYVYNANVGTNKYLVLNATDAAATSTSIWQNTAPTSTVFSIGSGNNNSTIVAYCFAPIAGYSAFGSYTGNGSTDGPFVYTGFRPAYVMIKRTDAADDWLIIDTSRNPYNVTNLNLWANLSSAEGTADRTDILSNGFKLRNTFAEHNASGGTYIYMAFATSPFKYSIAR